jgi:hypothetical protein
MRLILIEKNKTVVLSDAAILKKVFSLNNDSEIKLHQYSEWDNEIVRITYTFFFQP